MILVGQAMCLLNLAIRKGEFMENKARKEREKKILQLRANYTLKEIGEMFGLTKERIRQIEASALRRSALSKRFKEEGPITVKSDIERLDLPIRVYNNLRKSDINTIENIIESGQFNLLKIKSLAVKAYKKLETRCGVVDSVYGLYEGEI